MALTKVVTYENTKLGTEVPIMFDDKACKFTADVDGVTMVAASLDSMKERLRRATFKAQQVTWVPAILVAVSGGYESQGQRSDIEFTAERAYLMQSASGKCRSAEWELPEKERFKRSEEVWRWRHREGLDLGKLPYYQGGNDFEAVLPYDEALYQALTTARQGIQALRQQLAIAVRAGAEQVRILAENLRTVVGAPVKEVDPDEIEEAEGDEPEEG